MREFCSRAPAASSIPERRVPADAVWERFDVRDDVGAEVAVSDNAAARCGSLLPCTNVSIRDAVR
jgi:hypothetical protein